MNGELPDITKTAMFAEAATEARGRVSRRDLGRTSLFSRKRNSGSFKGQGIRMACCSSMRVASACSARSSNFWNFMTPRRSSR